LFNIEGNNRVIRIFTIYRITESTTPGIMKSKAQYDRRTGKVKTTREYREALLTNLSEEIIKSKEEKVDNVMISRDFNQDIQGERIQRFMRENRLVEVHETMNNIENNRRDKTHKTGSK